MRPKSMILILIALGCGLIASIGISQVVERGGGEVVQEIETSPIYVAVSDVDIGDELNAQRIKLEEWPIDRIPPGAVTSTEQLENMAPRQRLFSGEPILIGKLASKDSLTSASTTIRQGHRVMSVKVSMDTAVSHLIEPGDHVDVLAFVRGRGNTASKASTILSNIEVFAINNVTDRMPDESGSLQAKTVSLQVTPQQAQKLMFFSEQGRLRLTLRSPGDEVDNTSEEVAPEEVVPEENVAVRSTITVEDVPPGFRMQILDGSGHAREFEFGEEGELPIELTAKVAPNPTATPTPPFAPPGAMGIIPPRPGAEIPVPSGENERSSEPVIDETRDLNLGVIEF